MAEREPDDIPPPVIYMHQVWHGEENVPILLLRTPQVLIASLFHLPADSGSVCAYYPRVQNGDKKSDWLYRFYHTPAEAEAYFKSTLLADWNNEYKTSVTPAQWYLSQFGNGTELSSVQHSMVDKVEANIVNPIQEAIDKADKYDLDAFIDRLRMDGVTI